MKIVYTGSLKSCIQLATTRLVVSCLSQDTGIVPCPIAHHRVRACMYASITSFASHLHMQRFRNNLFFLLTDLQKGPPSHKGITENTAIIAGVVAALVLLVALTLLAVYYINTHPTVAPPFYLMQVRKANSCIPWCQPFIFLLKDTPSCTLMFVCCLAFSNYCLLFVATHQQLLALYEVPQPGMSLELR